MYDTLLILGVALWLAVLVWYVRQPQASAYHPASYYLLFHGVLFAIRPVLAWWQQFGGIYAVYGFVPSMADKATVLICADLALLVFVGVSMKVGSVPFARASPAERGRPPRLTRSFWLMCALCGTLGSWSLVASLGATTAGTGTMVLDTGTGIAVNTTGSGYFSDAQLMLGPIAVLIAWLGRFRLAAMIPLALFVLAKASTGGRWPFVMALLSVMLLWMYERRLRWPSTRLVAAAVPLLLLFTVIGQDRGAAIRNLFTTERSTTEAQYFGERPLESMDYANMEFFEYLVWVVPGKSGTYDYFLSNLQLLTEPVPRVVWRGKPIGPPIQRIKLWRYGNPIGMTASVAGAGWYQAGYPGVVLWTALFAWAYARAYTLYVRSNQNLIRTALYMTLLPVSLQVLRDGSLITAFKTAFYPLAPILVWYLLRRFDRADLPVSARLRPRRSIAA